MDPGAAHAEDWQVARGAGASALRPVLDGLAQREREWLSVVDAAPIERLAVGSGWGALEWRGQHGRCRPVRRSPRTP
jgi:hypothetical protein